MAFDSTAISNSLRTGLAQLQGFELPAAVAGEAFIAKLAGYLRELDKWNKAYNLTAVRDPLDMVPRHIFDALAVQPYLHGSEVLDVGTGAGLPGIPLALAHPDKRFTLLDSNGKKIRFVQHVVAELGIGNVSPVQARIETWQPDVAFDTIISRAFSSLADFVNGSGRLLAPGGCLLAMKGKLPREEINALPAGWRVTASCEIKVPGLDAERHVLVLQPSAVLPGTGL